jgi:2-polyprenyl-3-methyl-5-hydroxy-6-metoxy-1,4-benzoquinol methylase
MIANAQLPVLFAYPLPVVEAAVYEQIAQLEQTHWWHVARLRILRTLIDRYLPQSGSGNGNDRPRLCDIGCGAGALLREMAPRFDVTGVDSSPIAREICGRAGITVRDGTLPDGLPFADSSFDVVIVADVLEHVPEDGPSIRTLARLLKPGGVVIATVPAHPWMWSKHDDAAHHQRRYTKPTLRAIFEPPSGDLPLQREVLSYYNCLLFPPIAAVRLIGRALGRTGGSDLGAVPEPLNTVLTGVFGVERFILPHCPLPMGVSLVAVYRRT